MFIVFLRDRPLERIEANSNNCERLDNSAVATDGRMHFFFYIINIQNKFKQGRIHGNPVADSWVGAVIQKLIASLEIFVTDGRTDRHGKV